MKMGTVRKVLAFTLAAGLMVPSMSAFAKGYDYYTAQSGQWIINDGTNYDKGGLFKPYNDPDNDGSHGSYAGNYAPADAKDGDTWYDMSNGRHDITTYYFDDGKWWTEKLDEDGNYVIEDGEVVWDEYTGRFAPQGGSSSSSSKSSGGPSADAAAIYRRAEAEAVQSAAESEGFHQPGDMFTARENGMSAGEFYNNVVTSTPGIENAVTVGQGGNLVVDGQVTHMTASINKVTNRAYVDSVRAAQAGTLLNVVDVSYPVKVATVNFYMPGITGTENIAAYQYNNGAWTEVAVAEVRADHVTLNMTGNGVVAFIAK